MVIEIQNFKWIVNVAQNLGLKPVTKGDDQWTGKLKKKDDPFMPPFEDELVVDRNFTKKHRLILNKFPIANQHVLVITKDFEKQNSPLDFEDIEA